MWAPCKETVAQINPHRDSNEWGLVSCRREAINSPGFWAGIISGDCSWTYWGAQIVSATGKAAPPTPRQRGSVELSSRLSPGNVRIAGPQCKLLAGSRATYSSGWAACLPSVIYLFLLRTVLSILQRWAFHRPNPLHNPLPFPRARGQGKQKQFTSKGNLRNSNVDQSMVMGPGVEKNRQ